MAPSPGGTDTRSSPESQIRQGDKPSSHVELGGFWRKTTDVGLWHLHVCAQACRHTLTCTREQVRTCLLLQSDFCCCYHQPLNHPGEEMDSFSLGLIAYHQGKPREELQGRTRRQELKQDPQTTRGMALAHWLDVHGLFSLLSYTTQDYLPKKGITHSVLGPPTSIIDQENAPQICLQATWWRYCLNWASTLDISRSCQVNKTTQKRWHTFKGQFGCLSVDITMTLNFIYINFIYLYIILYTVLTSFDKRTWDNFKEEKFIIFCLPISAFSPEFFGPMTTQFITVKTAHMAMDIYSSCSSYKAERGPLIQDV